MKKRQNILSIAGMIILFFSISGFSRDINKDISISLREKRIMEFEPSSLLLVFYLEIKNDSHESYYITGYNHNFVIDGIEYIDLDTSLDEPIKIEEENTSLLSFPLKITYSRLFESIPGLKDDDTAYCYLMGGMTFSDGEKVRGRIRFSFPGEFPIFKKPKVQFISLNVKELTIGGSNIEFDVRFVNNNKFELFVYRISYNLELNKYPVGKGRIKGDKNLSAQGTKEFNLPLLVNFFEVGKKVYNLLHQDSILCRIYGEVKVKSIWGWLDIPFDKSERVTVLRTP